MFNASLASATPWDGPVKYFRMRGRNPLNGRAIAVPFACVKNDLRLLEVERVIPVFMIEVGLNYKMTNESNPPTLKENQKGLATCIASPFDSSYYFVEGCHVVCHEPATSTARFEMMK